MIKFWNRKKENEPCKTEEVEIVSGDTHDNLLKKLKQGLKNSSTRISDGISDIFTKKILDKESLERLEELLILSDMGVATASKIVGKIAKDRFDKEVSEVEVKEALASEIEVALKSCEKKLVIDESKKPFVILMVGVNGTGKTTSIGKMAYNLQNHGYKIMFAAGDTFRAAAVNQLKAWGDKLGIQVISKEEGSDPASLVYEAIDKAIEDKTDVLFIDTAGRLQNKDHLMEELKKINRIIAKKIEGAPHETIITLDATVGQNANSQVDLFNQAVELSGMLISKLDGTAKGGIVVSLAEKFKLPIYAVGIGEKIDDLKDFNAKDFSKILVGLE